MRISAVLFTCVLVTANLLIAAPGHGQGKVDKIISIDYRNAAFSTIISAIEKKADVVIMYELTSAIEKEKVDISIHNKTVAEVLNAIVKGRNLKWSYKESENIVRLEDVSDNATVGVDLKSTSSISPPPPITVRGRILNENNEPVIASVIIKGTTRGVTSNTKGEFELNNVSEDAVLIISATNIETVTIAVKGLQDIIILARTASSSLNEVVVNKGYYTERQRLSTGNVSRVTSKDIQGQPITSPLLALQGRVAGLEITPVNGSPGGAPKIQIRGNNSLRTDGSFPLYVIDGVVIESAPIKSMSDSYMGGIDPLSNISPDNIESIEVLKDADATAIYGSRGANGVILVTTKKGKQSGLRLNMGAYKGVGKIPHQIDLLNTEQYMEMRKQALQDGGMTPSDWDYDLTRWDSTKYTDWQKVLLGGSSHITDLSLSVEGGSETTAFRLGGNYHKETMILSDDLGFKNVNAFANFNHRSRDKKLSIDFSSSYGISNNRFVNLAPFVFNSLTLPPNAPDLYLPDGNLNWDPIDFGTFKLSAFSNPMAEMLKINKSQIRTLIANGLINYHFNEELSVKVNLGYTANDGNEQIINPIAASPPFYVDASSRGSAIFGNSRRNSWIIEPQMTWSKNLKKGNFQALIGSTFQESVNQRTAVSATGYTSDMLLGSFTGANAYFYAADEYTAYKYAAVFARVAYNYGNKYLINLTGRRDGSSRFGPGNRFGNFGAVGAAWIFSEEKFMKTSLPVISFAKIRTSYGTTGNDQIPDYQYYSLLNIVPQRYQNFVTLSPAGLFDRNFRWEATKKFEAALEIGLCNDRLSLQTAWFRNRTSNQLINYQLPTTTGFSSILKNFDAIIQNTGWEFTALSKNIISSKFTWNSSVNVTITRNKLVAFPGIENSPYKDTYQVGSPLSIQYLWIWKGVDSNTGIDIIEDRNGDGMFDDSDKIFDRSLSTAFHGGFQNSFQFQNFTLSFLIQFSKTNVVAPAWNYPGLSMGNQTTLVLNRWRKPGDQTDIPKYTTDYMVDYNYGYVLGSDRVITDGSFIKLKDFSVSYRLPISLARTLKMSDCQIFLKGQNLLTITNFIGLDPETGNGMPQLRMITCGVNFKF